MTALARIGLGTAQFGLDYGITNGSGQVSEAGAAAILETAAECGIDTIDTARLYGDSEQVIGRIVVPQGMRIVTKTAKLDCADPALAVEQLRIGYAQSLKALRRQNIYALLIHNPADLLGQAGPELWSALQALKGEGCVQKVGVSVYRADEIEPLCELYPLEIVQLPFNALDRRLHDGGQLDQLASSGIEIHARSLFLQGLLLAPAEDIPPKFGPLRSAVEQLDRAFAARGLGRMEGLLAVGFAQRTVDRFIVGVTTAAELETIVRAARRAADIAPFDLDLPPIDDRYLDPSRWSEL